MSASEDSAGEHNHFDSTRVDTHLGIADSDDDESERDEMEPISDTMTADNMTDSSSETNDAHRPPQSLDKGKEKATEEQTHDMEARIFDHEDRPNRWYGAPSTWMSWTSEERRIAESLVELRNRDLSAHIFNAHALQNRRRRANTIVDTDSNSDPSFEYVPGRSWTAWPLGPSDVPRGTIHSLFDPVDEAKYVSVFDNASGADLEECLLASILRVAKENFDARQSEDEVSTEPRQENVQSSAARVRNVHRNDADVSMFSSQAYRDDSDDESSEEGEPQNPSQATRHGLYDFQGSTKPVFLADDDEARKLLQPAIQKTTSQLDNLLEALHRSRQSYTAREESSDDDGGIKTSISRHRSRERNRRRSRSATSAKNYSELTDAETSQTRSSSRVSRHRKGPNEKKGISGLRDWGDIVAFAAISGWDSKVVMRAARRCARLFEEDMQFRTFHEGSIQANEPSYFTETTALGLDPPTIEYDREKQQAKQKYPCPHVRCRRRERTFNTAQSLNRHIRRYHTIDRSSSGISDQDPTDTQMSDNSRKEPSDKKYFCPVAACKRHTTPFSRSTKMYSHVKTAHPEIDLDEVKRLEIERRGERRGKAPKRSRSSQSMSEPQQ